VQEHITYQIKKPTRSSTQRRRHIRSPQQLGLLLAR
jgi:hypothetical protein